MKKIFQFCLVFFIAFILVACGEKSYELQLKDADKQFTLTVGDEHEIKPQFTEGATLTWEIKDPSVISVDNGKVKALKAGETTVTVSIKEDASLKAVITVKVIEATKLVTSITINGQKAMNTGAEQTLSLDVLPVDASNKNVKWESNDTTIATVTNGVVKALKAGKVTIKATAEDESAKTSEIEITITDALVAVTEVKVTGKAEMFTLEEQTLTLVILPANASNKGVTWTTSDATIATVTNGVVKALKAGEVTIKATSVDGTNKAGEIKITITDKVVEVESVSVTGKEEMTVSEEQTLVAVVLPENATNKDVVWSSSDETIATVTNGLVKALKAGEVTIKAVSSGKEGSIKIVITEKVVEVESVSVTGKEEMAVSEEQTLVAVVLPENATNKDVVWSSSDETIATVENGLVKALKAGEVTIKAVSSGKEGTIKIVITEPVLVEKIEISDKFEVAYIGDEFALVAVVTPENATVKDVVWSVTEGATIDATGKLVITAFGDITVTAEVGEVKDEFTFKAYAVVEMVDILYEKQLMNIGETDSLFVDILPMGSREDVTWTFTPEGIVTIDENCLLTAVGSGFVTIKATANDNSGEYCEYEVRVRNLVNSITIVGAQKMYLQEEQMLKATLAPSFILPGITWESSDPSIVSVNDQGFVKALALGEVVITVTSVDSGKFSQTFAIEVIERPVATDNVYVSADVKDMEFGAEITVDGNKFYVGQSAFETLTEGIQAASKVLYLGAGTYAENITIDKNGFSIIGPNKNIDPNNNVRIDEALITGRITVAAGVEGFTMNGCGFTSTGNIFFNNKSKNITLSYNNVFDTDTEPTAWLESRYATAPDAVFSLWVTANHEDIDGVMINNNRFDNVTETCITVARSRNVTVINNVFHNFGRDAFRGDGGYNAGKWLFEDNTFTNDTLSGYVGIYLQSVSGDGEIQEVSVIHNTFKNIGTTGTSSSYPGAFSVRTDQESGMKFEFLYNTFESCVSYLNVRNNGSSKDNWVGNTNYNAFVGVPTDVYHRNCRPGSNDNSATNLPLMNFDFNYFEDLEGNPIDVETIKDKVLDVASFANSFTSRGEYEKTLKSLLGVNYTMVVNPEWASIALGEKIVYNGFSWIKGTNAFASIVDALVVAGENETIYVSQGLYDLPLEISKNGITLMGPNYGVNPVYENRKAEAIIGNKIDVLENVDGFTVDGFEFTGSGCVNLANGTSNTTFSNITIDGTSSDGIVKCPNGNTTYNVKMNYCYCNAYSGYRFGWFWNVDGLEMIGNEINSTAAFDFLNVQGYCQGVITISDNTFINGAQSFLYSKGMGAATVTIEGNYAQDIANTVIDFRDLKGTHGEVKFVIQYNTFVNGGKGWSPIRIRTAGYTDEDTLTIDVHYNKFLDSYYLDGTTPTFCENPSFDAQSDPFKVIYNMDNNYYVVDKTPITELTSAHFCNAALTFANPYATEAEVPEYTKPDEIKPVSVSITNKVLTLDAYQSYQLFISLSPANATNKKVLFSSSNPNAAIVTSAGLINAKSEGKTTITVKCVADGEILDSFEVEILPIERIEVSYEGNATLEVGDTLALTTKYIGTAVSGDYEYTSSKPEVATVDADGVITAVAVGNVQITIKLGSLETKVGVSVIDMNNMSDLMKLLVRGNNGVVLNQDIVYIGSDDGSADYLHNIYGSVNDYWMGKNPEVTRNMLATTAPNYSGQTMESIEFIVVHDTAGSPSTSTAKANSGWCTNPTNDGSSWTYTIGNDGIYQQLEDNVVGWHAGDGTSWGTTTTLNDTGIKALDDTRAVVTIGDDGFFYVNGEKSLVAAPAGSTSATEMNTLGIACVIGVNGNYCIPTVWTGSSYGGTLNVRGGNLNGIGIETAVNMGSDVYLTWQMTAKFVAQLLVKYNLTPDRVLFHNNFNNKPCPRTMMTAGLVDDFLELVYMEYYVAKLYSDYKITFTSSDTSIVDNTGRIVAAPEYTANVEYTITIEKDGVSESITLNALVLGKYNI